MKPDLVVTSAAQYGYGHGYADGDPAFDRVAASAYAAQWSYLSDLGIPVVAIAETPQFVAFSPPECLSRPRTTAVECSETMTRSRVATPSRIELAAQLEPRVRVIDVDDVLCPPSGCRAVIGNVVTYRDDNHLTPQLAGSMDWIIRERLSESYPDLFQSQRVEAVDVRPGVSDAG